MITYQDLLEVGDDDKSKMEFAYKLINEHKSSAIYAKAEEAREYYLSNDVEILKFQKMLTKVTGEQTPDLWSANFKITSNFLERFITQKVQTLLGNGVKWGKEDTVDKLGTIDKPFDSQLEALGTAASKASVAFGFFNNDHIDFFELREFAPLYDEENGALKAGVRFWQIDEEKPLRAVLYEIDGYTEYIWRKSRNGDYDGETLRGKTAYIKAVRESEIGGTEIYNFTNYPTFPIVPYWNNRDHVSDFRASIKTKIDCYDLIYSGYADTIDEASYIYWTLQNAGGMQDDIALEEFVRKLKTLHAVAFQDEIKAQPNTLQAPFEAREALLTRIERDLYRDAMALDEANIASGAATATEIKAAYEPLMRKVDSFEYATIEFINGILKVAEIDDKPTFTRSTMINQGEELQNVLSAAVLLPPEYAVEKVLTILGDGDMVDEIIAEMHRNEQKRLVDERREQGERNYTPEENNAQSGAEGE
jgi:SPP1 family phage portal protein